MKQGGLGISAIVLGASAIGLLMPVPLASAAVRHHGFAGPAMHRSAMHTSYRAAWHGSHRYATAGAVAIATAMAIATPMVITTPAAGAATVGAA
jgi:hypothetical protein